MTDTKMELKDHEIKQFDDAFSMPKTLKCDLTFQIYFKDL